MMISLKRRWRSRHQSPPMCPLCVRTAVLAMDIARWANATAILDTPELTARTVSSKRRSWSSLWLKCKHVFLIVTVISSATGVCPVLCNGHGRFVQGVCRCDIGWKGAECAVPERECEVPDCNGNGRCSNRGQCVCKPGFSGAACEKGKNIKWCLSTVKSPVNICRFTYF